MTQAKLSSLSTANKIENIAVLVYNLVKESNKKNMADPFNPNSDPDVEKQAQRDFKELRMELLRIHPNVYLEAVYGREIWEEASELFRSIFEFIGKIEGESILWKEKLERLKYVKDQKQSDIDRFFEKVKTKEDEIESRPGPSGGTTFSEDDWEKRLKEKQEAAKATRGKVAANEDRTATGTEKLDELRQAIEDARNNYAQSDFKTTNVLSKLKRVLGVGLKTRENDLNDNVELYGKYKSALNDFLSYELDRIKNDQTLTPEQIKKEMGDLVKYFSLDEKFNLYDARTASRIGILEKNISAVRGKDVNLGTISDKYKSFLNWQRNNRGKWMAANIGISLIGLGIPRRILGGFMAGINISGLIKNKQRGKETNAFESQKEVLLGGVEGVEDVNEKFNVLNGMLGTEINNLDKKLSKERKQELFRNSVGITVGILIGNGYVAQAFKDFAHYTGIDSVIGKVAGSLKGLFSNYGEKLPVFGDLGGKPQDFVEHDPNPFGGSKEFPPSESPKAESVPPSVSEKPSTTIPSEKPSIETPSTPNLTPETSSPSAPPNEIQPEKPSAPLNSEEKTYEKAPEEFDNKPQPLKITPEEKVPDVSQEAPAGKAPETFKGDSIETAKRGDSVWKMVNRQLEARYGSEFTNMDPEKKTYIIDHFKDKIVKNPSNFGLENADKIKIGQKIDFKDLFSDGARVEAIFDDADNLSPEQLKNISKNNKTILNWIKKHPGESLISERTESILNDGNKIIDHNQEISKGDTNVLEKTATKGIDVDKNVETNVSPKNIENVNLNVNPEKFVEHFDDQTKKIAEISHKLARMSGGDKRIEDMSADDIQSVTNKIDRKIFDGNARYAPRDEINSLHNQKSAMQNFLSARQEAGAYVGKMYKEMFDSVYSGNKGITKLGDLSGLNAEEFFQKNSDGNFMKIVRNIAKEKGIGKNFITPKSGENMNMWTRRVFAKILEAKGVNVDALFGSKDSSLFK